MFTRTLKVTAVGGALLLGLAVSAYSNGWADVHHRDYITFSAPVAIPGVTLPAGTYRFEMPSSTASDGIVSVSSRDGRASSRARAVGHAVCKNARLCSRFHDIRGGRIA